jgi:D-alanyl-D-alanine carboxypeptidase
MRRTFALIAFLSFVIAPVFPAAAGGQPFDLSRAVSRLVASGAPGAVALLREGESQAFAAAGVADLTTKRPIDRHDIWRIASVTKLATAVVVMQLVAEGRVELSAPLGRYVAGLPKRQADVTVEQLLNQSTGIPEYLTVGDDIVSAVAIKRMLVRRPPQQTLVAKALKEKWLPVGREHNYSNTNYVFLDRLIEAVESKPFRTVIEQRVISPLGLTRTGFPSITGELPRGHIRAYLPGDGRKGPLTDYARWADVTIHPYALGGDGGLFASVDDLAHLLEAVWSGQLLPAGSLKRMVADPIQDHDGRYLYGLGVMVVDLPCGIRIYGHDGRDLGSTTLAFVDPAKGRRLVVTVNTIADGNARLDAALTDLQTAAFCSRRVAMVPYRDS